MCLLTSLTGTLMTMGTPTITTTITITSYRPHKIQ
jgi:hypothetical protein